MDKMSTFGNRGRVNYGRLNQPIRQHSSRTLRLLATLLALTNFRALGSNDPSPISSNAPSSVLPNPLFQSTSSSSYALSSATSSFENSNTYVEANPNAAHELVEDDSKQGFYLC